jgi:hypothetical protein
MKNAVGRVVLFVAGAAVALVGEAFWRHDGRLDLGRSSSAPALAPASRAAIAAGVEHCRDDCEQWAIVTQAGDAPLRCRAACERATPPTPHEPIRRVTRAPADHSRTLRDEPSVAR